jgi:CO/xanthine dehydrogenase FAD-binding subunit
MSRTFSPGKLADALQFLEANSATVVAGGTDVYPSHVEQPLRGALLDIGCIESLRTVERVDIGGLPFVEIGAAVTWSSLVRRDHPLLRHPLFDCLAMAAAEVGGIQIQNRGTIAGNLCNASPAADGVPALMALNAQVLLASARGERTVPLTEFIVGPRQTLLAPDELVRAIRIPFDASADVAAHSMFLKLGHRRYLVISAVMVAARLDWISGRISDAAISVGACGRVAARLGELEARLVGLDAAQLADLLRMPLPPDYFSGLSPISDARGSAAYRLHAAATLVHRALACLADAPGVSVRGETSSVSASADSLNAGGQDG